MVMNCEGWNVGHVRQMGTEKYINNFLTVKTEGKGPHVRFGNGRIM
jgi:hypothetical protein